MHPTGSPEELLPSSVNPMGGAKLFGEAMMQVSKQDEDTLKLLEIALRLVGRDIRGQLAVGQYYESLVDSNDLPNSRDLVRAILRLNDANTSGR